MNFRRCALCFGLSFLGLVPAKLVGAEPGDALAPCLALGAGGATGLAHVAVLEVLDAQGARPARIAGSSIGAVVGALYASGLSGAEIRDLVLESFSAPDEQSLEEFLTEEALRWAELVEVELGDGGLLSSDGVIAFLIEALGVQTFDGLSIPLAIVAGDLWSREQVVIDTGDLPSAIRASMALPGVFQAVQREGRTLIDGGTVNPVPFDLFGEECDYVIAVDVAGVRTPPADGQAAYLDTLFNSVKVMQQAIVSAKRRIDEPDLYLAPEIRDVRALEFYRAKEVFDQSRPMQERLTRELQSLRHPR